jgi:hypothetical protein
MGEFLVFALCKSISLATASSFFGRRPWQISACWNMPLFNSIALHVHDPVFQVIQSRIVLIVPTFVLLDWAFQSSNNYFS